MPIIDSQRLRASRREFLVGAALGSVSLASGFGCGPGRAERAAQTRRKPGRTLGVALVGLGNYSETQLAPALQLTQYCELRGIVTGSPDKAEKWQKKYGIPRDAVYDYASLPRIADNPAIDVVYVVTPTALHPKYAILAAQAGKHVWCEKPMAMNVDECQTIIDACRFHQRSLSIGYRLHHEPNTQSVIKLAHDKPYGAIKHVRAIAGDRTNGEPTWRMNAAMGGGALYDMGVYSINAIRYATGEEPLRVTRARQWSERSDLFRDVDEISEFELALPSGAVGFGRASRNDSENKLRVEAERGWYELEPMQAYDGVEGETSDGRKLDRKIDKQQARQMDDEALAILERRAPIVPGEEGQRDVRVIQAIIQAAKTGAAVDIRS